MTIHDQPWTPGTVWQVCDRHPTTPLRMQVTENIVVRYLYAICPECLWLAQHPMPTEGRRG